MAGTARQLMQRFAHALRGGRIRPRDSDSMEGPSRALLQESLRLQRVNGERVMAIAASLEHVQAQLERALHRLELSPIIEERTRTLEFQTGLALFAADHEIDLIRKWYLETVSSNPAVMGNNAIARARQLTIKTEHPIAYESNDHITPDSTAEGSSRPTHFVRHCVDVLGPQMRTVDIGTGAAGLVYEFLMNDVTAIGIDGSDYCRRNRVGYWPAIDECLHTCDVTYPFAVKLPDGEAVRFELITMWEVLEHIDARSLPALFGNVRQLLAPGGYYVGSVSLLEYNAPVGTPYHVTRQPRQWWRERFAEQGLTMLDDHPFNERLFCRGNGPRFQDVHNYSTNPQSGFHFVAQATQT